MRRLVGLLALLFFASGCLQAPEVTEENPFVESNRGLVLNFYESTPPSTLLSTDIFQIAALASNEGEYNLDRNRVNFTLGNARTFGIAKASQLNGDMIGGSKKIGSDVIPGESYEVRFDNAQYKGPQIITAEAQVPVSVTAFYPYETDVISKLCVSRSGTSTVCPFPRGEGVGKKVFSSGAPVKVTEVKQYTSTYNPATGEVSIVFAVNIENVGDGDVYETAAVKPEAEFANFVKIWSIDFGGLSLDTEDVVENCDVSERANVYVTEDGGFVNCRLSVPADTDFEDILSIRLRYNYVSTATKSVSFITFKS